MAVVRRWAEHENYHVRRLASEGIRPLLPWSERVTLEAEAIVAVLEALHADPTRYVTRSVANNLNDLSKKDAALVLKTLKRWRRAKQQHPAELDWMTRHALRTLTKNDNLQALALLGFPTRPKVTLETLAIADRVAVGERLQAELKLRADARQKLLVTLRVHFLKANGRHSPKVFQVAKAEFDKGELAVLRKTVVFRPMTTRTLYPGTHRLEVLVNGKVLAERSFELVSAP